MTRDEPLIRSIIFNALAKPNTLMGVDYDYCIIAILLVTLVFIYSGNFLSCLLFGPLHLLGWILCKVDPHIFRLLSIKSQCL